MATRSPTHESTERPAKRAKLGTDDYFDDPSKEVQWPDIEKTLMISGEAAKNAGWISGNVFMVFGNKQKREAQLISTSTPGTNQIKIAILGHDYQRFKFAVGQSLKLSLRGGCIVRVKNGTSVPGYMPFNLIFREGAAIKFVVGAKNVENDTVVDSWQDNKSGDNMQVSDDWFISSLGRSSGGRSPSHDASAAASSSAQSSPFPETPERHLSSVSREASVTIGNGDELNENLAMDVDVHDLNQSKAKASVSADDSDDRARHLPENKTKKLKKRDMRHDRIRGLVSDTHSGENGPSGGLRMSIGERRRFKRELALRSGKSTPEPPKRNPALDLVAGLSTQSGAYPPLESIRADTFVHAMGVVGEIGTPSKTRRNDFCVTITLVDPSKFQDGAGFKVTCFMKVGFEHMLPSSAYKGHALLLRNVRTTEWRTGESSRTNGTVYPEKLKWVGYNPDTGKLYYPETTEGESHWASGLAYSAFYQPKDSEIQYLVQLGDWWRAIKEEEQRGAIQIEDYSRKSLEHRLLGTCDVNKFFNATVEILRVEEAESGQSLLFFTDYTPHPLRSTEGFYGQWAVHASTDKIKQYLLDVMKTGTYWSINNLRLKIGSTGGLEADLYAARIYEIDDEEDLHLRELLKRKEAYLRDHPQNPEEGNVSECTISDISETGHYNIIAELLYKTKPRDTVTDLFVTDYTDNSLLSCFKPDGLKQQLAGSQVIVFQISAWDGHDLVRDMEIGNVYSFADVRVKAHHDGGLRGNLKFADKRITRMSVKRTENPTVLALLQRKAEHPVFAPAGQQSDSPLLGSPRVQKAPVAISNAIKSRHTDQPKSTIRQILSNHKCPNKFRLTARIVNFFPLDISDFAIRWCSNCNKQIPDEQLACAKCDDFMSDYVRWVFQFFFVLEDEEEETLLVDMCLEAKYFLLGIQPCDLKENHNALWSVKRRLRGCLGNLVEVHEAIKRNEIVEVQYGPYFDLAIKSWEVADGRGKTVRYALTGCEAVEPST